MKKKTTIAASVIFLLIHPVALPHRQQERWFWGNHIDNMYCLETWKILVSINESK